MEFPTQISGDRGYVKVIGNLDSDEAGQALKSAVQNIIEQGKKTVVLDLTEVKVINSFGIGQVFGCHKQLKDCSCVLMVKPLSGFVKETFELLLLDKLLPVDP